MHLFGCAFGLICIINGIRAVKHLYIFWGGHCAFMLLGHSYNTGILSRSLMSNKTFPKYLFLMIKVHFQIEDNGYYLALQSALHKSTGVYKSSSQHMMLPSCHTVTVFHWTFTHWGARNSKRHAALCISLNDAPLFLSESHCCKLHAGRFCQQNACQRANVKLYTAVLVGSAFSIHFLWALAPAH